MLDTRQLRSPPGQVRRGRRRRPPLPVCTIRVQRHADWTAILLRGELDLDSRLRLDRELRAELDRGRPLIVELAGLDFTDLNGIRFLQELVAEGASSLPPVRIELHGARGQVADLISRLGLDALAEPTPSHRHRLSA